MDLFNLDRAYARSKSDARSLKSIAGDATFRQLVGQNDKRIALMVAASNDSDERGKVYLSPDQSIQGSTGPMMGIILGYSPIDFTAGTITLNGTFGGSPGVIAGTLDGNLDDFTVAETIDMSPSTFQITGGSQTITSILKYDQHTLISLRTHGDIVRAPWFFAVVDNTMDILVVETFAEDCCIMEYADSPYPKR